MARGTGKYAKQRKKAEDKYFRKKFPKYPSGVQFAEEQPEPNGYDGASSVTKWASTGGQMGGPAGAAVGAAIGTAKYFYDRKKIKEANRQIRAEKEAYDDFGGYATDPKLQTQEMIAKDGKAGTKKGVIEIEGKKSGEIHTDSDFNLKNVGTRPHSKGGNKVVAEEGDVVFDTQNDPKEYRQIMSNIKKYKMGSRAAGRYLEKKRKQLPSDNIPKKVDGDGDVIPPTVFGIPQEIMDKKRGVAPKVVPEEDNDTGPYDFLNPPKQTNPFAAGEEGDGDGPTSGTGTGTAYDPSSNYGLPEGVTLPEGFDFNPDTQDLVYNQQIQDMFDKKYGTDNQYMNFLIKPEVQAMLQQFREEESSDPKAAYKHFQDYMSKQGMAQPNAYMDWLRVQGFDPGTEGWGDDDVRNFETMTLDSSLRWMDAYNKDKKFLDDNLFGTKDRPIPEKKEEPIIEDEEEPIVEEEEGAPAPEGKKKKNKTDWGRKLRKNANVISNMIDFAGDIEGYQKSGLNLGRYKYQDMSAPKIKAANEMAAVHRKNRRNLVGSKGQQVSQASQDEVAYQKTKERIYEDEIARKMNIENANVGLMNQERMAGYKEDIRAKDVERMQRAKKRQFGRAAMAEIAQMADLDEERMYMMSKDDKLYARDAMLANVLGTRSYDLNVSRDEETGQYNPDVDLKLREEYEQGKKTKKKKEEEVPEKKNGSRKIKLNTRRYK